MITELPLIGKILSGGYKAYQHFNNKKDDEKMRTIADELRRRAHQNNGNCLKPEVGSEQDRLCTKMVAKGYLVRVPFGYMLPEFTQQSRADSLY